MRLYKTVQPLKVKQDEDLRLEVIRCSAAPTLGTTTVQIRIARGSYEHEVVISANRENPNRNLGSDFLCQHDCDLSMRNQQIQVEDRQIRCVPEPEHVVKAGLKIAQRIELPARTEVIVSCKPTPASSWLQRTAAIAQPCSNQWRYAKDGTVIGSAWKTRNQSETVIPVMNLTDDPRTLYQGTRIAEAHVITKCDRVKGLLPATPRDIDDSDGSDNEGWLRERCIKYHPNTTLQGRCAYGSRRSARVSAAPDGGGSQRLDPVTTGGVGCHYLRVSGHFQQWSDRHGQDWIGQTQH